MSESSRLFTAQSLECQRRKTPAVRTAKLGESPAQRTVGFIERAMPADGSSRCPLASNGDVGTSRLEEQL